MMMIPPMVLVQPNDNDMMTILPILPTVMAQPNDNDAANTAHGHGTAQQQRCH